MATKKTEDGLDINGFEMYVRNTGGYYHLILTDSIGNVAFNKPLNPSEAQFLIHAVEIPERKV